MKKGCMYLSPYLLAGAVLFLVCQLSIKPALENINEFNKSCALERP